MVERFNRSEELLGIARKRGLFWPSNEIYGGVAGFYDFGPIGLLIKNKIVELWRQVFIREQYGLVVEIETPVITPRIVLKASGHEDHFTDPITVCTKCSKVYRADHIVEELAHVKAEGLSLDELWNLMKKYNIRCPEDNGELTKPRPALLLFKTEIGPYKGSLAYIRPETAQGIFVSFKHVFQCIREKLPIGIAQIGKVGRNEISPRQGLIRLREFTIMEFEFFFDPSKTWDEVKEYLTKDILSEELNIVTADIKLKNMDKPIKGTLEEHLREKRIINPWLGYWMVIGNRFLKRLGIPGDKIRFEEKLPHERAHYADQTFDQQVYTEKYGWIEVAGFAYRTDYDLRQHIKYSGKDLAVFKRYESPVEKTQVKVIPVIEKIKELAGNNFKELIKEINSIPPETIAEKIESEGKIVVKGFTLTPKEIIVKKEKVKIYGEKIVPHVVEPSYGLERVFYVVLENSLTISPDGRVVLKLPPEIAPYDVAVFPLVAGSKEEHKKIRSIAYKLYKALIKAGITAYYDEDGSIGKRYARADEIGIPYAITVDYQTLSDQTVTIRHRDTREQKRVHLRNLYDEILKLIRKGIDWRTIIEENFGETKTSIDDKTT